jgi:hypothetical protein
MIVISGDTIVKRVFVVAALSLLFSSPVSNALAGSQRGVMHRMSCSLVRFYVAKYSESAAEMWARSHGASDAEIEAARHCLNNAPAQNVQAAGWFSR